MKFRQLCRTISIILLLVSANLCLASDPFAELDATVSLQKENRINEASDFEAYKKAETENFQSYMRKVQEEFKEYRQINQLVVSDYKKELSSVWKKPEISSQKRWIIYDENIIVKTVIDFDNSEIQFLWPEGSTSFLNEGNVKTKLEQLLRLTRKQAFEKDPVAQRIEFLGRQKLDTFETDQLSEKPILWAYIFGNTEIDEQKMDVLVKTHMMNRKKIQYEESGQGIIGWVFPLLPLDQVITENLEERPVSDAVVIQPKNKKKEDVKKDLNIATLEKKPLPKPQKHTLDHGMADENIWKTKQVDAKNSQNLPKRAIELLEAINRENEKFDLSVELILAIVETESAFNPMAKSPVPAYGLMQIVPESAGQDATAKIFGRPRILAPSYLYNTDNNIKVGAAYFNILFYQYFRKIENLRTRLYCAIAAYNTGPGNVAKTLTGKNMSLKQAAKIANQMNPEELYNHLMTNLPYNETVHYLRKVTERLHKYEQALSSN